MKTIYLVRHGKAAGRSEAVSDFDRPLTDHGREASIRIGDWLKQRGVAPDILIVSPAPRAGETATIIANALGYPPEQILTEKALYDQPDNALYNIVRQLDDAHEHAMIIGHEPLLSEFLMGLTGLTDIKLPACGVASISLDITVWSHIARKTGALEWLEDPDRL